ncbi:hypothetical protein ACWCQK_00595 [Streptomyces sp. NPDC002306]
MIRERAVQTYFRSLLTVCALSGALLVAACGEGGEQWPTRTTAPRPVTADTTVLGGAGAPEGSGSRSESLSDVIGPLMVPEIPDLRLGGGLLPDYPDGTDDRSAISEVPEVPGADESAEVGGTAELDGSGAAASIFDSPTDLFAG